MTRAELRSRIEAIEASYEFLLAFAAQGIADDAASALSGELRGALARIDEAVDGLADGLGSLVAAEALTPAESYRELQAVLGRDAHATRAAIRLVRSRASISSALVDNLNAYTHLRALLTDLFLLDELIR